MRRLAKIILFSCFISASASAQGWQMPEIEATEFATDQVCYLYIVKFENYRL